MWRLSDARRRRQKEEKSDSGKRGGIKRYYDKIYKIRIKEIQKKNKKNHNIGRTRFTLSFNNKSNNKNVYS